VTAAASVTVVNEGDTLFALNRGSRINRVIWGTLVGLLTAFLIIAGGLATLQAFVVLVGLPTALMCAVCLVGMSLELERQLPVLLGDHKRADAEIVRTRSQDAEQSRMTQSED
jgi:glycine betaine transporter